VEPIPHTTPGAWPGQISPSRFAAHVHQALPAGCRVAMIGLADDLGVRLNGGRPGAREGPGAFRAALSRYGVADPDGWEWPIVLDAGDVVPAAGDDEAALAETHRRVTEAVAAILGLGLFPIGIGGGHDLTFPFVRAVVRHVAKSNPGAARPAYQLADAGLGGVYFDAHLDVRETAGSGMAFRRLIEECGVSRLDLYGFCEMANSREHAAWFRANGGTIAMTRYPDGDDPFPAPEVFVSFDLDVLDAAYAPGVSAMNPAGWSPMDLDVWARGAGANPRVRCLDIMELCPAHDEGGRTARIAAHLFLSFLRGFAERPL
jgi:arginase family enzyme